jgi:hypothetical protein
MDYVEFFGASQHLLDRHGDMRGRISTEAAWAKRLGHSSHESAGNDGVAAGECRDLMAASVQFRDERVNDTLRPAIGGRRDALKRRRHLGDPKRSIQAPRTRVPRDVAASPP